VTYEVQRVEERLGVYDVPALEVRLNTDSADVLPSGRFTPLPSHIQSMLSVPENRRIWGELSGGRVDITNGERRHLLLRSIVAGQDRWYALKPTHNAAPALLDRTCLEEILEDLLK
jgi:hypothetical protein